MIGPFECDRRNVHPSFVSPFTNTHPLAPSQMDMWDTLKKDLGNAPSDIPGYSENIGIRADSIYSQSKGFSAVKFVQSNEMNQIKSLATDQSQTRHRLLINLWRLP